MKKIIFILTALLLLFLDAAAEEARKTERSFSGVERIELKLASSDCQVRVGAGAAVKVVLETNFPADRYMPKMEAAGGVLQIGEEFEGSSWHCDHCYAIWRLEVPKSTAIELRSASGDVAIEDVGGRIDLNTASGDVRLNRISGDCRVHTASGDVRLEEIASGIEVMAASGDIRGRRLAGDRYEFKVASGDIELRECRGGFKVMAASGDIDAKDLTILSPSAFKVASGDVELVLAKTPAVDLSVVSASGDAELNYNGNPLEGSFEVWVKKDHGGVESSVSFDKTEEVLEHGQVYIKRSFSRKAATPLIVIKTASGTAILKER